MNLMISVIIPCYNAWDTLSVLLASLYDSSYKDFEVIVVDDCSTSGDSEPAKSYPITLRRLERRSGPAAARNRGADSARGDILLFLDADVIAEKDTLSYIARRYSEEKGLKCLVGIYAPAPANRGIFPSYKALLATYWFRDVSQYNSFETACGSIRKDVFKELGGFDERFRGADVEDYEFGYRLRQKYRLVMDNKLRVKHHFPSFRANARNYFKRAYMWTKLFRKRREFDQTASSLEEVLRRSPAILLFLAPVLAFISLRITLWVVLLTLVFYIGANGGFFYFCLKERGSFFLLYSIGVHMVNSLIIFFSAFLAFISVGRRSRGEL